MKNRKVLFLASLFSVLPFTAFADEEVKIAEATEHERVEEIKTLAKDAEIKVEAVIKNLETESDKVNGVTAKSVDAAIAEGKAHMKDKITATKQEVDLDMDQTYINTQTDTKGMKEATVKEIDKTLTDAEIKTSNTSDTK